MEPAAEVTPLRTGSARDFLPSMRDAAAPATAPAATFDPRENAFSHMLFDLRGRLRTSSSPCSSTSAAVSTASCALAASTSSALSRSIRSSYLPSTGLIDWMIARSFLVTGPRRERGGLISVRCTIEGAPSSIKVETSASPTRNSVIASSTSRSSLMRNVSAAALIAFLSRGVKARRACWTRLPNWPATSSGISIGFWVTK